MEGKDPFHPPPLGEEGAFTFANLRSGILCPAARSRGAFPRPVAAVPNTGVPTWQNK